MALVEVEPGTPLEAVIQLYSKNDLLVKETPLYPQLPLMGQFPTVTFEGDLKEKVDITEDGNKWQRVEKKAQRVIDLERGLRNVLVGTAVVDERPPASPSGSYTKGPCVRSDKTVGPGVALEAPSVSGLEGRKGLGANDFLSTEDEKRVRMRLRFEEERRNRSERSVIRYREMSDSEDWDESEVKEQCPVTVLSKREGLKKESKELRKMKDRIKHLERALIKKEEREKQGIQAPITEVDVMMPLLIKGNVTHYQPWGHSDLDGLIFRLPILQEGAGIWIGKLESEMVGKRLAVGDIKALLSQILTRETTTSLLNKVGLGRIMGDPSIDEVAFDNYRNAVWRCLRNAYPNVFSLASMSVNKIKTDENPAVFVEGVEADWRVRMETDPENNQMVRHMMRKAIMEALPESAKNKLENDYRIESMLKTEFRDAVTHYVNLQRKVDADLEKQHVERQRKLVQNQLDNDEGTKKGEIQAPQLGVIAQAPKQDLGQGKMLVSGSSPLAIQQQTPIPQVAHGTSPQMPYWVPPSQQFPQLQAQQWGYTQGTYEGPWSNSGLIQLNERATPHHVMALQEPIASRTIQIYWIGLFGLEWENRIWSEWGPFIHDWHGGLVEPGSPTHCTIMVEEAPCDARKVERDERWRVALTGKKQIKVRGVGIIVGPEGVGVEAKLDPQLYTKAYDVPNATPHITLKVGLGFRAIDVGHMMARAKASVWVSAEWLGREGVRMSEDNTLIQIRHSSRLTGEPQVVEVIE